MALNLSRDAKLYIATAGTVLEATGGTTGFANVYEIPMLDGFSFTQDSGTQDITVSEAGDAPVRGMKQFTTTLNPVDVSFSAYVKPYIKVDVLPADPAPSTITNARVSSVEMILWNALVSGTLGVGNSAFTDVAASGIAGAGTITSGEVDADQNATIDFGDSNVHELLQLDLYFNFENLTYKVSNFSVNSAEVDFSIDGIATISWSGQGLTLESDSTAHTTISGWTLGTATGEDGFGTYTPAPYGTLGCIKNRFTTMSIVDWNTGIAGTEYTIPITGGSITIDNGITYLTPEELGRVNSACGSFTGTRSITGSVTAYLNTAPGGTADLLDSVLNLTDATNTVYYIKMYMGGAHDDTPIVLFDIPTAHLVIPSINIEDVIATEITFVAQGSTGLDATDEMTIVYNQNTDSFIDNVPTGTFINDTYVA